MRAFLFSILIAAPAFAQENPIETQPQPQPPQTQTQTQQDDDPTPVRLSAFIANAAATQRRARIVDGVVGMLLAGGSIAAGSVILAIPNQSDGTKALGWVAIVVGGVAVLTSVFGLFSRGSLELLDEAYTPIARDKSIPAQKRLATGEDALESIAASGKRGRIIGGVTSIVLGVGFGIAAAAVPFAVVPETDPNKDALRAYFGLAFGIVGVASLVKRTEAEQLWSLWLAGTGRGESRNSPFFRPSIAIAPGGIAGTF